MILHNTALLYIISLFNRKIRRNAIISFEFSAIIVVFLSVQLYDQVYQIDDDNALNCPNIITSTFIDSNGIQYNVTDE